MSCSSDCGRNRTIAAANVNGKDKGQVDFYFTERKMAFSYVFACKILYTIVERVRENLSSHW